MLSLGRHLLTILGVALAYFVLAKVGLSMATVNSNASPVWPASGLAFAAGIVFGWRAFLGVFLGAVAANLTTPIPLPVIAIIGIGNTLEAIACVTLFKSAQKQATKFGPLATAGGLLFASLFGTAVSAAIGPLALFFLSDVSASSLSAGALTWWIGDAIGCLFLCPLLLAAHGAISSKHKISPKDATFVVALMTIAGIFSYGLLHFYSGLPYLCLALPIVIILSYRYHGFATYAIAVVVAATGVYFTYNAQGPFRWGSINANLINLQIFLGMIGVTLAVTEAIKKTGVSFRGPAMVLFGGAIVNALVTVSFVQSEIHRDNARLESLAKENQARIESRVKTFIDGLKAGSALLTSMGLETLDVKHEVWRAYVESLGIMKHYPGSLGLGLVRYVKAEDLPSFEQSMRKHIPEFSVRPIPLLTETMPKNAYYVITHMESYEPIQHVLGVDLGSERRRRQVFESSASKRSPTLSSRIVFYRNQESPDGFMVALPIFTAADVTLGWIMIPMLMEQFFSSIGLESPNEIGFQVTFKDEPDFVSYQSFSADELIRNPRRTVAMPTDPAFTFNIRWFRLSGFVTALDTTATGVTTALGLISLILASLFANMQAVRIRAEKIAVEIANDRDKHRAVAYHATKMTLLGEMAAGIAHEINNPLAVISAIAQQLMRLNKEQATDPKYVKGKAAKVQATVERITKIVQALRTFSRSAETLPRIRASLSEVVEAVLDLCRERFKHANIDLKIDSIPDVQLDIVTVQIEQILMNLLSNAYDAVQDLDQRWIHLTFETSTDHIRIRVTDSGIGIPSPVATRIMEPFFTTKDVGKGTGLGLSISKGIAEDHGGTIELDTVSHHTSFVLSLPLLANDRLTEAKAA